MAANTGMQSKKRLLNTAPRMLTRPTVGFSPTMPLQAAGTRPEPPVSLPSENDTTPRATATAEPELDPPVCRRGSRRCGRAARGTGPVQPGGELVHRVLADQHAPPVRAPEWLPALIGLDQKGRAVRGRSHAGDMEIIFHREVRRAAEASPPAFARAASASIRARHEGFWDERP